MYDTYAFFFAVVIVIVIRFACTERLRSRLGHDSARRHRVSRPFRRRVSACFGASRRRFYVFSRKRFRRRLVVVVLRIAESVFSKTAESAVQGVLAAQLRAHRGVRAAPPAAGRREPRREAGKRKNFVSRLGTFFFRDDDVFLRAFFRARLALRRGGAERVRGGVERIERFRAHHTRAFVFIFSRFGGSFGSSRVAETRRDASKRRLQSRRRLRRGLELVRVARFCDAGRRTDPFPRQHRGFRGREVVRDLQELARAPEARLFARERLLPLVVHRVRASRESGEGRHVVHRAHASLELADLAVQRGAPGDTVPAAHRGARHERGLRIRDAHRARARARVVLRWLGSGEVSRNNGSRVGTSVVGDENTRSRWGRGDDKFKLTTRKR